MLVLGLWNVSLLFSLSLPEQVLPAISLGVLATLGSGYVMSRVGSYEAAIFGFTVGAAGFACLTTFSVLRALQRLDHRYFASSL